MRLLKYFIITLCFTLSCLSCDSTDFHDDLDALAFNIIGHNDTLSSNTLSCEFYNLDVENRSIDLYVYPSIAERLNIHGYKYSKEVTDSQLDFELTEIADGVDYSCVLSYTSDARTIESEIYEFKSTFNNSVWKRLCMVEDLADDFHKVHKGNGTIYYFSGEIPRSYYKFNKETNTLENLSLDNLYHFYTDNDIPHYIRGFGKQITRLNENDELDVAYKVETNIVGKDIDFGYKHNDKVVFNQNNKIFTISLLEDYVLTEVSEFPINHFGGLNQFYNFRSGNIVYFLFPENFGGVIYTLNLDTYEWNIETDFPGEGANYYWFTGEGEDIIMGGGAINNYINVESRFEFKKGDFWKYNISNKTWEFLGYIPYDSKFISSNVVSRNGIHYFITSERLPFSYLTSFDFKKII